MPVRLFIWLYREQDFSCLYCPLESVLWDEAIRLMQAGRRRQPDQHIYIYMSVCVCFDCVKGKIKAPLTDFPEVSSSVINLSLNMTSKNCSSTCDFLPSPYCCSPHKGVVDYQGHLSWCAESGKTIKNIHCTVISGHISYHFNRKLDNSRN